MKLYREHYYSKKNTINSITEPYIAPTVEDKINDQLVALITYYINIQTSRKLSYNTYKQLATTHL